jgi:hypothetical protein
VALIVLRVAFAQRIVSGLQAWWHRELYERFIAGGRIPIVHDRNGWSSRTLALISCLYCTFTSSYIVLFYFQQEEAIERERNLSVYAASVLSIVVDLIIVAPIALLFSKALVPSLVRCVLRASIAQVMSQLDNANSTNRAVLRARAVFLRTIGRHRATMLVPTSNLGPFSATPSSDVDTFSSSNPLHQELGGNGSHNDGVPDVAGIDLVPDGWSVHPVPDERRAFFFHAATDTCQWEHPAPWPPLPTGWIQAAGISPTSGALESFYHYQEVGHTSWTRPEHDANESGGRQPLELESQPMGATPKTLAKQNVQDTLESRML